MYNGGADNDEDFLKRLIQEKSQKNSLIGSRDDDDNYRKMPDEDYLPQRTNEDVDGEGHGQNEDEALLFRVSNEEHCSSASYCSEDTVNSKMKRLDKEVIRRYSII